MGASLDQRRAKHAWLAVEVAKTFGATGKKEYGGHAKKLPVRILNAGLGQALGFLLAKAGNPDSPKEHKQHLRILHEHITDWVIKERGLPGKVGDSLLKSIAAGDSDFLRQATDETLAYLQWLNRFAEAEGLADE